MHIVEQYGFQLNASGNLQEEQYLLMKRNIEVFCRKMEKLAKQSNVQNISFGMHMKNEFFASVMLSEGNALFGIYSSSEKRVVQKAEDSFCKIFTENFFNKFEYRCSNQIRSLCERGISLDLGDLNEAWQEAIRAKSVEKETGVFLQSNQINIDKALVVLTMAKLKDMPMQDRQLLEIREIVSDVLENNIRSLGGFDLSAFSNQQKSDLINRCEKTLCSYRQKNFKTGLSENQQAFFKESPLKNADGSLITFYASKEKGLSFFDTGTILVNDKTLAPSTGENNKVYEVFVNGSLDSKLLYGNTGVFASHFEAYLETIGEYKPRPFRLTDAKGFAEYLSSEDLGFTGVVMEYTRKDKSKGCVFISLPSSEIKETEDLTPRHDGKINSKDALSVNRDKTSLQKNMKEKTSDTRKDAGER